MGPNVRIDASRFSLTMGTGAVNPRWVIGAFIIKHKLRLSDEETLLSISENPYMQFFLACRPTAQTVILVHLVR